LKKSLNKSPYIPLLVALAGFPQISETIYTPALPDVVQDLATTPTSVEASLRRIFGHELNEDVLIRFINDIMDFQDGARVQEVTILSPKQNPEIAYEELSSVDAVCKTGDGRGLLIEVQVTQNPTFVKRAQYYVTKAYSRHLEKEIEEYGGYYHLNGAIFIAICNCTLFPHKEDYISHHIILDKHSYEHDLKDLSFTFIELPKFPHRTTENLQTASGKWCYFFKHATKTTQAELEVNAQG
jgi:predicted transposase/invertase (TIGR01784 family)